MTNDQHRYRPRELCEIDNPVSLLNEPLPPANVSSIVRSGQRSLHAVLVESLNHTQALLARLEAGVHVPDHGHEIVRQLYVSTRRQRDALAACLGLDWLE